MRVTKRDGTTQVVAFDKITRRLKQLCSRGLKHVDIGKIVALTASSMFDGITTQRLDELTAEISIGFAGEHPDYGDLAARIAVANMHKLTKDGVLETFEAMADVASAALLSHARAHADELQSFVEYDRDYSFDFFGAKTMERIYCTKIRGALIERPQHVYLRVALALWGEDMARVRETYDLLSQHAFTHASPTLFNAGTRNQQLASCFLLDMPDSLDGIFGALHTCARISKMGGGIGMDVSAVRSKGAPITSTNGVSDGIVPMLKVANSVAAYVNQSGKRKGSVACYLSPDHPDVLGFLELRRPGGDEASRCRDLFLALWVPDLFMRRVEAGATWTFFDPYTCPGLRDAVGTDYEALYARYEEEPGRGTRTMPARDVWELIVRSQIETGVPYLLFKDACNTKSNQSNLGTIHCSNLCSEIVEFTSPTETAVCTLASISLPAFVSATTYDFDRLHAVVKSVARNLDRVIDVNAYPTGCARLSNARHRPVGIGVQGLADVFMRLRLPFESEAAADLNARIFATVYHAALETSCELAREVGYPYPSYEGSPMSRGMLQCDLWGVDPHPALDWTTLRQSIARWGVRNSLSIAVMPTASTSQLLGNTESIEPVTSLYYVRRTLAGEFTCINKHLVKDLLARKLWTPDLKNSIIEHGGSIQHLTNVLPQDVRELYKTAWEIKQRTVIDQSVDRGPYVCQSQSLNLFVAEPTLSKLSSMHFYSWRRGLKTGMYYLRTKPAANPTQITLVKPVECTMQCTACSS